jgi:signal recognition particle subunit SRP54
MAARMKKGEFDLEDMAEQIRQMEKLGGMGGVLGMLPGVGKMKSQLDDAGLDDKLLKRQRAIISSMTPHERRNPKVLDGKRKRRIAAGSGTKPEDVNRVLKMHRQMADVMKMMGKNKGMMQRMAGMMGIGGGGMPQPTPEMLEAVKRGEMPKGLTPPGGGGMPRLPGLGGGGGLPGLPGLGGPKGPSFPFGGPGKKK